jgi:outer membrane protein OmpA-like peptidoglycan-associated protein
MTHGGAASCTKCGGAHRSEVLPSARTAQRKSTTTARRHTFGNRALLSRLQVSQPGDRAELDADQTAARVMRMQQPAAATVARSEGVPRPASRIQRRCAECEKEIQRKESPAASGAPAHVDAVPGTGAGRPLSAPLRGFFEPRFGHDFGDVRIHTGGAAHRAAHDLNAVAFTTGSDIVFAEGAYSPHTASGKSLLAHELTHVVQQRGSGLRIQRECGDDVPATPGCVPDPGIPVPTEKFLFDVNCDRFAPLEEARLERFVRAIPANSTVRIVGLASSDGPTELNDRLSCSRAAKGEAVVRASLPPTVRISSVGAVGEVPGSDNDATLRAVGIGVATRAPPIPPPVVKPGPRTPCERDCAIDFDECVARSMSFEQCLAARSACLSRCTGAAPVFEVCARLLQPPVAVSGCNHTYVETPTKRYAIQTLCTPSWGFAFGTVVAIATDRSPDPCHRRPTCLPCTPAPGVTDVEACLASEFAAYPAPAEHHLLGPNSNTFASTLARRCCAGFTTTPPATFGCVPGWGMALPAARPGTPCPATPAC